MTTDQEREKAKEIIRIVMDHSKVWSPAGLEILVASVLRDHAAQAFREGQEEMRDRAGTIMCGDPNTKHSERMVKRLRALPLTERK